MLRNWQYVIDTCNPPRDKPLDPVSRWLVITRACVFSMTYTSGIIGGLLAATTGTVHWGYFALAVFGLVLAHAANNMTNDYFDAKSGLDTDPFYARAQYSPHPLIGGLTSEAGLVTAILALNLVDAAIALYLTLARDWPVMLFALLGLAISVFYVAPPIKLKYRGLGELGIFLVWGPLMIGGTYYVAAGNLPAWVLLASIPYALLVTTVIIGKHLDKWEQDKEKGVKTLPVAIGFQNSLQLNQVLMVGFFLAIAALVVARILSPWTLLVVFALPRLRQTLTIYNQPKPKEPPPNYPVWPLWYVSAAFWLTKRAGYLFFAGLFLGLIAESVARLFLPSFSGSI